MYKFTFFSAIIPAGFALYGIFTMQYEIALNSAYTLFLIGAFWLIHKKFPVFKISTHSSLVVFILLSVFLGRTLGMYSVVPHWDKLLHFLSGFIFAQAGKEIYVKLDGNKQKSKALLNSFALLSAFSIAGLWEIWEFASDKILNTNAQNGSLNDTMYDIIAGSLSAIIKVAYDILRHKKEG
jgi:uncharacterized membrane protein YjdF